MRTFAPLALTSAALLALAGCGGQSDKTGTETSAADAPAAATDRTLAAALKADADHAGLARLFENSGLSTSMDGVGPYTVFAPADSALKGADFTDPSLKAEGAALLRAHILPGALTRADIVAAVDKSAGKGVQMRTMAGGMLTFTQSGQDVVATAPDGASARLTGEESLASNGVLQPIDGLLVKPTAAPN